MVSSAEFDEMRSNLVALSNRVDLLEQAAVAPQKRTNNKKRKSVSTKATKPGVANAYMFWLNQMGMRESIKSDCIAENPGASMTDVARKAGELWRNMPADEKTAVDVKWKTFNENAERIDADARNHWITELGMGEKFKAQLLKKNPDADADQITLAAKNAWEGLPIAAKQVVQKQYNDFKDLKKVQTGAKTEQ